jgi:hypothetical protein
MLVPGELAYQTREEATMKTHMFVASLLLALLAVLVLGSAGGVAAQNDQSIETLKTASSADLTLVSISPSSFANNVNMPVTITGTNLDTATSAALGTVELRNLTVINSTQVTALVPWSIAPGTYDLTVQEAGGAAATLPSAVSISAGSTDWTSNGPYGSGAEIVIDPVDASRMYVAAARSGLWKSQDGGASWSFSLVVPFPHRVQITYPTPGQPPVMYLGGDGGLGLQRSLDYGETWEDKTPPDIQRATNAFVHPGHPNWVYLGTVNTYVPQDPLMALYKSNDMGETWKVVTGTQGLNVASLAFDPDHPDLMVLGTWDGKVYTTTNDGLTWSEPITVGEQIGQLYFAPTLYNGQRGLFAIPSDYEGNNDEHNPSYRSTDGGRTWSVLDIAPTAGNPHGLAYGLAFHDSIPGLMWAAVGDGYYSEDGGVSWNPVGAGLHEVHSFLVVPGAATRQTTTLFAGDRDGLYKSTDGGATWNLSNTGLGTELARTIAISPFNADEAYIAIGSRALLHTYDGGRSWQRLSLRVGSYDAPIAPDPFTDGKVYVGYVVDTSAVPVAVWVSSDHGSTFIKHEIPLPPEYAGQWGHVQAIAPDPQTSNRLLAGLCLDSGDGLIYASTDGGVTWNQQTTPAGLECIYRIVFDPNDASVVYAGSIGSGLLRSTDGGATWNQLAQQPASTDVYAMTIDPDDSLSIYTSPANTPAPSAPIYATHDGGDTWVEMTGSHAPVWELRFCQVGKDYWLFAATMNGLQYLRTIPPGPSMTWESASGIAGVATVDGFACGSDHVGDARTVYYIGTSGGTLPFSGTAFGQLFTVSVSQNFGGGVYRRMGGIGSTPSWKQVNIDGFGDPRNGGVFALAPFAGQLYAGTVNGDQGAQLWRTSDGATWTSAMSGGFGQASNTAIDHLLEFNGQLYAGTAGDGESGGEVWRSDGLNWTRVVSQGFGDPTNGEILRLAVFSDTLYASAWSYTSTHGAEIWRSSTGDPGDWTRVVANGFNGDANNAVAPSFESFNGHLYAGTLNTTTGGQVWRTTNGTTWAQVNANGFGTANNRAVSALAAFKGYLYAGTVGGAAGVTGAEVWRCQVCDGSDWTKVVNNGFGDSATYRAPALEVLGSDLYFVVGNNTTGMEVWRTSDGTSWEQVGFAGFGDTNNSTSYWDNSVAVFDGSLYVGTVNSVSGGEVWLYLHKVYLPLVMKR